MTPNDHTIKNLSRTIIAATEEMGTWLIGQEAVIEARAAGRWRHRAGVVTAVMPDAVHGCRALVMVWDSKRPGHYLTGDRRTRSFWAYRDLRFTGVAYKPVDCVTGWVKT